MSKIKVDFIQDAFYNGKLTHKLGDKAVELEDHMANRWIKRGVAVAHSPLVSKAKDIPKAKDTKDLEKDAIKDNTNDLGNLDSAVNNGADKDL